MNTTIGIAVLVALGLGGRAWAGQPNTNQAPQELRMEINLIDGSRMIGVPTIESVPIQTSYAKMAVPLKQVLTIKIENDHETASIELRNGDKLKGLINLKAIPIETIFGKVSVGTEHIKDIADVSLTTASFIGANRVPQGNWKGVYGGNGYAIVNDSTHYPAYAQVTPTELTCVWEANPTADPRALQRTTSGRIAACWHSPDLVGGSFDVDVNLTDGAVHRVALYLVDWDVNGREMRVDVLDAATQHVLATQTVQSFQAGIYLEWNLRGHVILRFTSTGGTNAVLSGIFFDAPNRSPVPDRPMPPPPGY